MNASYLLTPAIMLMFILICWAFSNLKVLPHLEESTPRYGYIDGLRGIAAVLVVCAHSWRVNLMGFSNDEILKADYFYNPNFGAIGVQIFFCITGFLFYEKISSNKRQDWYKFFLSRFKRIAPLYSLAILLLVTITAYNSKSFGVEMIPGTVKMMAFGLFGQTYKTASYDGSHLITVLWTLPFEWKFYAILPLIAALMSTTRTLLLGWSFTIILLCSLLYADVFNVWVYFVSGAIAAVVNSKFNNRKHIMATIFFLMTTAAIVYSAFIDIPKYGWERFMLSTLFFVSVIMAKPKILSSKPLVFMGEISYSVYLMHVFLFFLFGAFIKNYVSPGEINNVYFYTLLLSYCVVTVSICTMTFKYIEYPFIRKKTPIPNDALIEHKKAP
ncbi:acyltransferase [Scandinavium sp. TWS1a]|uniref:acyltransferase family protein n=1 Tax=Scandinavium tedordense TaxID=2926521 RepID=UPI002165186C|nr:acyltransferase [Scandinavium tedordense]MCS2172813.1 acyltransferase [Scandinavium tedordense]